MSPTTTGFARYRTRSNYVTALHYTGDNLKEATDFLAGNRYEYGLEPDDWIVNEDGVFEVYTGPAFKAEFEPVVEAEYGWDGIIVEHPQAGQFRLPLVGAENDDAVLVLDREYMVLLAATIRDLLGDVDD